MKSNPCRSIGALLLWALLLAPNLGRTQQDPSNTPPKTALEALNSAKDDYERWAALGRAAKESLNQGHDAEAKALAEELQKLAPKYPKDWNYGNAVQDFNLVLGRLALKSGETDAAKKYLLAAGASPGSPQMNSFGPNMTLARDLLAKGEKDVVVEYFELCRKFWKMEDGKLDQWKKDIDENRTPDFGANLVY